MPSSKPDGRDKFSPERVCVMAAVLGGFTSWGSSQSVKKSSEVPVSCILSPKGTSLLMSQSCHCEMSVESVLMVLPVLLNLIERLCGSEPSIPDADDSSTDPV